MILQNRVIKNPPFSVINHDGTTLTNQIEDGLRQAIETGFYQDGDFFPGYVELARQLGVSVIVVRRAIGRLIAAGLCHPRRGVGLRVCSKSPAWVGNVLVVTGGDVASYRYYMANLVEHLRRRLAENRLSMTRAIVAGIGAREDFSSLDDALNRHVSLAIATDYSSGMEKRLRAAGIPYILTAPAKKSHAAGYLAGDPEGATAHIVAHCVDCGVRRVLLVGLSLKDAFHVDAMGLKSALGDRSLEARWLGIETDQSDGTAELLLRKTVGTFSKLCEKGHLVVDGFRPDMVIFLDDYVAQGALLAMTAAGIRIPEDLQVITMANKGLGPVWLKPLTRFEVDAAAEADAFATLALRCLRERRRQHTLTTSTTFIEGETTRLLEVRRTKYEVRRMEYEG